MDELTSKIVVICGATATGKTAVSVRLAKALARDGRPGEVINADSTQVYRGMDIGTAKATAAEQDGVPHHLFDIRDPDSQLSAPEWARLADEVIAAIAARGGVPIVVGGTGFYLRALLEGLFDAPPVDPAVRERLAVESGAPDGPARLRARLEAVDPVAAAAVHPNDLFRTLRALEVFESSGQTITSFREKHEAERAASGAARHDAFLAGLAVPRDVLYARIDARQAEQVRAGLLDEYRALLAKGFSPELKTLNGLCYRHMRFVVEGKMTLEEAVELDRRDNRRYAKRQLTWFRNVPGIVWFDPRSQEPALVAAVRAFLTPPIP